MENKSAKDFVGMVLRKNGFQIESSGLTSDGHEVLIVNKDNIFETMETLKNNLELQFDILFSVTGVDYPEHFEVVYHLFSTKLLKNALVKAHLLKEKASVQSASSIFSAADWHEREVFDLFGIYFEGHENLKRILLPDDWKGHPLRKDYVQNDERLVWNKR